MNDNNENNNDFTPPPTGYGQLVKWFRQATPYINAHRHKTFVISLGGEALLDANISNIIHDIALLNSLSIRIVVVHGYRAQLQNKLAEKNINSPLVEGLRVTDASTIAGSSASPKCRTSPDAREVLVSGEQRLRTR